MTTVARTVAVLAVVAAILMGSAATPPAQALSPTGAICSLTGIVSTLASRLCDVAAHPGRLLSAGKQLLGGRLGGALESLAGVGGSTAARAVGLVAIAAAVVGGARYLLAATAEVIGATTRPNLTSTWFSAAYWRMAAVSALLTLPFLFAAAVQAMVRSDLGLLARAAFGYLPLGMLAVGVAAPLTMLLLAGSDEMSALISSASGHAGASFLDRAGGLGGAIGVLSGSVFVTFFVALLTAAATLTLWIELLIRDAAVYVIVLMLPLFFAAMVWPARRVWAIRAVELLVALILSKFVIVAVLSLGGAALGHTLFPHPAAILAGTTLVMLAAFSPWALLRLLPLHEVAAAAVGGLRPKGELPQAGGRAEAATDAAERMVRDRLSEAPANADASAEDAGTGRTPGSPAVGSDGLDEAADPREDRAPTETSERAGTAVSRAPADPGPDPAGEVAPAAAGDAGSGVAEDAAPEVTPAPSLGTGAGASGEDPVGPMPPELDAPKYGWRRMTFGADEMARDVAAHRRLLEDESDEADRPANADITAPLPDAEPPLAPGAEHEPQP
ncbi:MAG TPA: hypothetical protein VFN87_14685 [Solirubrobacteraceae bacterium]|nr:hypothetical protein [Solirubrobacteraceae bacterium]